MSPTFAAEEPVQPPADIESVIISGHLNKLREVQKAIVDAEDRFYARYNQLNKNHDFDIECSVEAPTGTRLEVRECLPKFAAALTKQDVRGLLSSGTSVDGGVFKPSAGGLISNRMPELKSRMAQVVRSDPELQRLLRERALLAQHYKELSEKKFKGHLIVVE
jgi:hypothetical protein